MSAASLLYTSAYSIHILVNSPPCPEVRSAYLAILNSQSNLRGLTFLDSPTFLLSCEVLIVHGRFRTSADLSV
jgi:hypothetical protein